MVSLLWLVWLGAWASLVAADDYKVSGTVTCATVAGNYCQAWNYDLTMASSAAKCFDGHAVVHTPDKDVRMRDLLPHTEVLAYDAVTGRLFFDRVYTFLHTDARPWSRRMLRLCTNVTCIMLSDDHVVFRNNDLEPQFAHRLRPGDAVHVTQDGHHLQIQSITNVTAVRSTAGLFAPATYSGTIVVNRVLASVYAATEWQAAAHRALAPLRWYHAWVQPTQMYEPVSLHPYAAILQKVFFGSTSRTLGVADDDDEESDSSTDSTSHSDDVSEQKSLVSLLLQPILGQGHASYQSGSTGGRSTDNSQQNAMVALLLQPILDHNHA